MKSLYKYAAGAVLAGALSILFVPAAEAQRGRGGGGGGGVRSGGGGVSIGGGGGFRGGSSVGIRSGIGYRPGATAGVRSGSNVAARGGVYHSGGYYGGRYFYGYPTIGFRFGYLPYGYYPFYFGADLYYYYGGAFYRPDDDGGYEVATPPLGAAVPELPKGAQSIVIDGQQFYEFNGVYYQQSTNDQGKVVYVVAGKDGVLNTNGETADEAPAMPQVGDIVNQLPDGSRKVKLNGKKYFVGPDGIYYEEFKDSHNYKSYRVVSVPSDNDQDEQQ